MKHELSLDFTGEAQHRRGYRRAGGKAPLKENLAAAILYLAGWPEAVRRGLPLVDPTCGSGTFLAEAALMATDCAPGLLRERFGFEQWLGHDPKAFDTERDRAAATRKLECPAPIYGFDASTGALDAARQNLEAAGVASHVTLAAQEVASVRAPGPEGILVCNPPYGERLGDSGTLFLFYQTLGDALKRGFGGWTAYVFAAQGSNLKHLGLRPARRHVLYNGAIECRLLEIPLREGDVRVGDGPAWRKPSEKAEMFANRIKKNKKKWGRWAKRNGIDAYRVYDADIPEFNVAVDRYPTKAIVHVFQKERDADDADAQQRVQDVILTLPEALGIEPSDLVVKVRRKHDQGDQYARIAQDDTEIAVREGDLRFIVNLEDRIDTGLFLDHRQVRAYARERCEGKRMLNLFAYTCSVSVAAAVGGAKQTTSVDLSNTYLEWGRRNFQLNDLNLDRHRFFRNDALQWMARRRDRYDWIFINPPTFSRSKGSKTPFNIHKDHKPLIEHAMRALTPDGELLFTTHARAFELDPSLHRRFHVQDTTSKLVPPDFTRYPFKAFTLRDRLAP
jgi:23S rRNA (guanine2445-N2)-methyltransferase / 23S rRNA (guanine2069-N7)-methyltransferase